MPSTKKKSGSLPPGPARSLTTKPDITYNPGKKNIPNSTKSLATAKMLANPTGRKGSPSIKAKPDIAYNPTNKKIPNSTRSQGQARAVAGKKPSRGKS